MRLNYIFTFCFITITLLTSKLQAQDEVVDESTLNRSKQHSSNGWDLIAYGKFNQALEQFNMSLELWDGNADTYVGRATALMKLQRLEEAEQDVETALELVPNQADMFFLAGNVYFKMKNYIKATENYGLAIRTVDESEVPIDLVNCYYNRGNAFFESGMYRSAIRDYSKVIEMKEDFTNAYHNRALSYKNREDFENACKDFAKAKELGSRAEDKYMERYCN